ncbi:hypothetical protein ON064_09715 [Planococcus sp. A6]|uniref:hypothetical protein n=1 Tax=Planococcus sp. A6 TaxID=2992760 RepID=UPI00237A688C|nr:hypothetical protein [Planococcus sp. A6]MDE0583311.1 hypothetical protein [Planococcus sp. A6]
MEIKRKYSDVSKTATYFFTRSKHIHEENGIVFLTLFARLTREFVHQGTPYNTKKIEPIWVNVEELKLEHATEKMKLLPNYVQHYEVSKEIFLTLYNVSLVCPHELYYVTPFKPIHKVQATYRL